MNLEIKNLQNQKSSKSIQFKSQFKNLNKDILVFDYFPNFFNIREIMLFLQYIHVVKIFYDYLKFLDEESITRNRLFDHK